MLVFEAEKEYTEQIMEYTWTVNIEIFLKSTLSTIGSTPF